MEWASAAKGKNRAFANIFCLFNGVNLCRRSHLLANDTVYARRCFMDRDAKLCSDMLIHGFAR